ncbi:MAG TPA: GNAT family N-acetyltransferase [Gemmatimonadaceae bacterium]|nr:GNAT family N-acetyltransferase [Gemmatimonadaceae bacterium]
MTQEAGRVVKLDPAIASDSPLLSNLLQLYIHDLSDVFPQVELGHDGRYGYERLPLYWSDAQRRFAFVIRCDGRPAGFVLATRGSPVVPDPDVLDVAEFFVIRRHRRAGVGRAAAYLLWNLLAGKWTVRVLESNSGALAFWRDVVAEYSKGTASESKVAAPPNNWRVFSFECTRGRVGS